MPCKPILMQVALAGTQIFWTTEVNNAFHRLEEGYENALKDYYKKQISQLNALIVLLLGSLSKGDRQKVSANVFGVERLILLVLWLGCKT